MQKSARQGAGLILGLLGMIAVMPVHAINNCKLNFTPIDFGLYYPMQAGHLDVTATLDIQCTGTPGNFTVGASPGSSNSFTLRTMTSGTEQLNYNLFIDAARSIVWGDINTPNVIVANSSGGNSPNRPPINIFGREFSLQDPAPGLYSDVVTVTVQF